MRLEVKKSLSRLAKLDAAVVAGGKRPEAAPGVKVLKKVFPSPHFHRKMFRIHYMR